MKRHNFAVMRRIASVLFVLGCAAGIVSAAVAGPKPKVAISGAWSAAGDSITVTASWTAVQDARGGAVQYQWAYWTGQGADAVMAGTGAVTSATSVSQTFARPLAGDSTYYSVTVVAVDVRGKQSAVARSPYLLVVTPWTPPPPPVIRIDTVAYDPAMPDTITFHINPATWGGPVRVGALSMGVGDTVTLCGVRWQGGYGEAGAPMTWSSTQPAALQFTPTTPDCALLRTLAETALNVAPYPHTRLARP